MFLNLKKESLKIWVITYVILLSAFLLNRSIFAGGEPPEVLKQASNEFITKLQQLTLLGGTPDTLSEMLALPTSGSALTPIDVNQVQRINRYKARILKEIPVWFDNRWLPSNKIDEILIPLAEKVDGMDSFGGTLMTPLGIGYMKVTYGHFFLALVPDSSILSTVPKNQLQQYSIEEELQLSNVDKARYRLTKIAVEEAYSSPSTREYHFDTSSQFSAETDLLELTSNQAVLKDQALAVLYLICNEKMLTRCKWRIDDVGIGLFGESIMGFPVHIKSVDGVNYMSEGFVIRFFTNGKFVYLMVSRNPDIFYRTSIPKRGPNLKFPDWFSRDVEKVFTTPPSAKTPE